MDISQKSPAARRISKTGRRKHPGGEVREKACQNCGGDIKRQQSNQGHWEAYDKFARRQYCSKSCANAGRKNKDKGIVLQVKITTPVFYDFCFMGHRYQPDRPALTEFQEKIYNRLIQGMRPTRSAPELGKSLKDVCSAIYNIKAKGWAV